MSRIILVSGPRGAGKSTHCNKCVKENNNFYLFSRDDVGRQFFGEEMFNPYTCCGSFIYERLLEKLERFKLLSKKQDLTLIVDYWNGTNSERYNLLQLFRKYSENVLLYISTTPHDKCVEQFFQREGRDRGWNPSNDYKLYYKYLNGVEYLDFDKILYVDPTLPSLF